MNALNIMYLLVFTIILRTFAEQITKIDFNTFYYCHYLFHINKTSPKHIIFVSFFRVIFLLKYSLRHSQGGCHMMSTLFKGFCNP